MSDLEVLAAEAYVYGYPLVFNLEQVQRFTAQGMGSMAPAPFNTFSHAGRLAGPEDTFVSINNDTVYSMAQLDLGAGPLLLRVPDTAGRYYVLQFVDAWTNNFAYVGRRATGTGAGTFLITPPGWDGAVPDGATRIAASTRLCTIVGRWAVDGAEDLPAVAALQQALTLEPAGVAGPGLPEPDPGVGEDLEFFEKLRLWMRALPPATDDQDYQQKFQPLGLLETASPYTSADAALSAALRAGLRAGKEQVEQFTQHGVGPEQNGWRLAYHAFDYNLDHFSVGTEHDPRWIIPDRARARTVRAAAARTGLWGNHGYEAAYTMTFVDGDGRQLDGSRAYTMRFGTLPPVDAFWSITMYSLPDYYLVANPADRYSIGDRTPELTYAADGSLSLYLQPTEPPDPDRRTNWLPTPPGRSFRPTLRLYEPQDAVFDGTFTLPPVTAAD